MGLLFHPWGSAVLRVLSVSVVQVLDLDVGRPEGVSSRALGWESRILTPPAGTSPTATTGAWTSSQAQWPSGTRSKPTASSPNAIVAGRARNHPVAGCLPQRSAVVRWECIPYNGAHMVDRYQRPTDCNGGKANADRLRRRGSDPAELPEAPRSAVPGVGPQVPGGALACPRTRGGGSAQGRRGLASSGPETPNRRCHTQHPTSGTVPR